MSRKQTRRSISVSGPTYSKLKAYCESTSQSMSGVVEDLIKTHLAGLPEPKGEVTPLFSPEELRGNRLNHIRNAVERMEAKAS